jgi:Reverse transcriptase (RNA-dependent DNA polymerase)
MQMFAHIVDVQSAFLTGDLSGNPVYISVPQGMEAAVQQSLNDSAARAGTVPLSYKNVVLKLMKSLYGLVQSSHLFWRKQTTTMINKLDLERRVADYCLYHKWIGDKLFISINWVDDIILAYPDELVVLDKKRSWKEHLKLMMLAQ